MWVKRNVRTFQGMFWEEWTTVRDRVRVWRHFAESELIVWAFVVQGK